ncbi:MAG: glycosyltransferase, exosortase A system-associated [Gammaproteobacteria bacterium]|nr:glycosyltransferase, exosortase A system-associated [Gammaproteobacteria bacterium]
MSDVLHVLDHSLPEHDGYAFRSHSILTQLIRAGWDIDVITGPKQGLAPSEESRIDSVNYIRTPIGAGVSTSGVFGQLRTINLTRKKIESHLQHQPAKIIHSHSPCLNGLAALGHGVPVVYEMRSSWEDASVSVGTTQEGSMRYRLSKMFETYVANRADAVVVICDGLKAELTRRGVSEDKITVVPNALSEHMFKKPDADKVAEVRKRYSLTGCKVVGFFGSFFEWEGIDGLIKALPAVLEIVPNARLLIAGGGRQETALHSLVAKLGLEDEIVFAGRVAHEEISACYVAADVMAYPRISDRLTDMVTPLKPLEAMAQSTVVVASDVGGHRELVVDGDTGILFESGNYEDLARKLVDVLCHPEEIHDITVRALDFVQREKRWSTVVKRYLPVYEQLVDG